MGYEPCRVCGKYRKHGDYGNDQGEHVPQCPWCHDPGYFDFDEKEEPVDNKPALRIIGFVVQQEMIDLTSYGKMLDDKVPAGPIRIDVEVIVEGGDVQFWQSMVGKRIVLK